MGSANNHYAILGVLSNAEDIVIRAAYKALAQRYHPDKSDSADYTKKMAEINEAYRVLSDVGLRRKYDQANQSQSDNAPGFDEFDGSDEAPPPQDPLLADWLVALRFFPDLAECNGRLEKIAWRLASSYRAGLLDSKRFERRAAIAFAMERGFLERYFGKNELVVDFASNLIQSGMKHVARDLNEAVRVLGSNVAAETVIAGVKRSHPELFPPPAPPPPPPPSPPPVLRENPVPMVIWAVSFAIFWVFVASFFLYK